MFNHHEELYESIFSAQLYNPGKRFNWKNGRKCRQSINDDSAYPPTSFFLLFGIENPTYLLCQEDQICFLSFLFSVNRQTLIMKANTSRNKCTFRHNGKQCMCANLPKSLLNPHIWNFA
jgi:hypothetical protein